MGMFEDIPEVVKEAFQSGDEGRIEQAIGIAGDMNREWTKNEKRAFAIGVVLLILAVCCSVTVIVPSVDNYIKKHYPTETSPRRYNEQNGFIPSNQQDISSHTFSFVPELD